jgi:hypothetical protein
MVAESAKKHGRQASKDTKQIEQKRGDEKEEEQKSESEGRKKEVVAQHQITVDLESEPEETQQDVSPEKQEKSEMSKQEKPLKQEKSQLSKVQSTLSLAQSKQRESKKVLL